MESREDQTQPREGKQIAIVGFADTYKLAPYTDTRIEIWGLNELHKYVPRWDRWFELHDAETLGVTVRDLSEGEQKRHLQWLASQPKEKPIYMQPQFCDGRFPGSVPYPLEAMCARFGRYFTSSIGFMLALAIAEIQDAGVAAASWIGLYGVDLASDIEYPQQRPNTEYFIGLARGLGIQVEIPAQAAIMKAGFLYGYERPLSENPMVVATKTHLKGLVEERDKTIAKLNTLDGAIQANENLIKLSQYGDRGVNLGVVVNA